MLNLFIDVADGYRRLEAIDIERRDFIWYMLKQAEKFDLQHEEIIANSALFLYVVVRCS